MYPFGEWTRGNAFGGLALVSVFGVLFADYIRGPVTGERALVSALVELALVSAFGGSTLVSAFGESTLVSAFGELALVSAFVVSSGDGSAGERAFISAFSTSMDLVR